jgi:hypothetical protein
MRASPKTQSPAKILKNWPIGNGRLSTERLMMRSKLSFSWRATETERGSYGYLKQYSSAPR